MSVIASEAYKYPHNRKREAIRSQSSTLLLSLSPTPPLRISTPGFEAIMEIQGELISMTYTWTIDNFSKLKTQKHYSDGFVVGDFKWRIVVYPQGSNGKKYFSMYLNVADASKLPAGWSRYAQFTLTVVNQFEPEKSITIDTQHQFCASKSDWGFTSFMPLSELCDPNEGYIVDDILIVEAEVAVSKADIKILKDLETAMELELQSQGSSNMDSAKCSETSTAHTSISSEQMLALQDAPSSEHVQTNGCSAQVSKMSKEFKAPKVPAYQETYSEEESSGPTSPVSSYVVEKRDEKPSSQIGELVDFRGLGKISITYVPLLEEVCTWHPSLIESQRKRSRMFAEWAFTALGRLLHFLNATRVKDMMEDTCEHDSCEHLQVLWDEVETFKFDLTWLEPFVQSALAMKKFGEKEGLLKKLRDDVDTLETEIKRLRDRLAVAEVEHELARTDLAKAEESFGEAAMNSKLGYGRH